MSGRLSRCSVAVDSTLCMKMHQTPKAPVKTGFHTPIKSERKKTLFQGESPTDSVGLGGISPLSSCAGSSDEESIYSPICSPSGVFSTPPRRQLDDSVRRSPRNRLEVKSSLFPNAKTFTPKTSRTPKFKSTTKCMTPMTKLDEVVVGSAESLRTPSPKKQSGVIIAETPSTVYSAPIKKIQSDEKEKTEEKVIENMTSISPEDFYGSNPPRARQSLFSAQLYNEKSMKNMASKNVSLTEPRRNRSLSGGSKRASSYQRPSKRNGYKIPNNGVWHALKKPKPKKNVVEARKKPVMSPNTRIALQQQKELMKKIVKANRNRPKTNNRRHPASKRTFEELTDEEDESGIIDPFPHSRIKRRLLSTFGNSDEETENVVADPNKKFVKYGHARRATFTLNDHIQLQYSNGKMSAVERIEKSQSKKQNTKRRKLYSPPSNDYFNDVNEPTIQVENIENILRELDDNIDEPAKIQLKSPVKIQVERISDQQLFNILDSPSTKVGLVNASPSKVITAIDSSPTNNKLLNNMSSLALDENKDLHSPSTPFGNVMTSTNSILQDKTNDVDLYTSSTATPENKLYSVFYKNNWNKTLVENASSPRNYSAKKKTFVPDNQYLLDAGQKSIGIITCSECGVMYQSGDFADEATHNAFHNHLPELRFPGWSNERVVGKYADGRILMILSIDNKLWWKKIAKIVEIVDQDLGFPETAQDLFFKTVYLYINEKSKQIVGCLVAEECRNAYRMYPPMEGVEIDSCERDPTPCKIGVSRVWTALSHRRQGVATRLVHCLQRSFIYGEVVPLDQIAFTSPSVPGKQFAQKVIGRPDILVYGFHTSVSC